MSQQRIIVAKLVRENKNVLFAPFNEKITRKLKEDRWEEIRKQAIAAGCMVLTGKNWKDVRDNYWGSMKRDFLAKRDKYRQSGSDGGAGALYPFNEVLYDITMKIREISLSLAR